MKVSAVHAANKAFIYRVYKEFLYNSKKEPILKMGK